MYSVIYHFMQIPTNKATLVIITQNNKILLGMKKRGFGKNKYNGFGGKPESDESLMDCIMRETKEESGLDIVAVEKVGILTFYFETKPEWNQQVHIYSTSQFSGTLIETEEMKSKWFDIDSIPYDSMWVDDKYWLPLVLDNKKVTGSFTFDDNNNVVTKELTTVTNFT